MSLLLLAGGFAAVLAGALLFTNAVEWAGHRLQLGVGAVGTLLAGVSTALPESVIPIVAVLRNDPQADQVAIGAIIGAPFLLATVAMALVGVTALMYAKRRDQGRTLRLHRQTLRRDLSFFLLCFAAALAVGIGAPWELRLIGAVGLVVAYGIYVVSTVRRGAPSRPKRSSRT